MGDPAGSAKRASPLSALVLRCHPVIRQVPAARAWLPQAPTRVTRR